MSVRKTEVQEDVGCLTEEGYRTALSVLIGMDVIAVAATVEYVQSNYPGEYRVKGGIPAK